MSSARPIQVRGSLAYVPLTQGREAVIDAADVPLVEGRNWHVSVQRGSLYAARRAPAGSSRRILLLHRVIMAPPDDALVDHINCDGLDCRRLNMRLATKAENGRNRRTGRNSASSVKGVSFHKKSGKWRAYIKTGGKNLHIGLFATVELAAEAYRAASEKHHGVFGRAT